MGNKISFCVAIALLMITNAAIAADKQLRETCSIKGNISYRTGEKIYHIPGQQYYSATKINPAKGERWFCSESEAKEAGWRKSKR